MTSKKLETPAAFKASLEQRLRKASATGVDFARRRQLVVFERFLARVFDVFGDAVLLKGGLVLELRLDRARTTKDVDLRVDGSPAEVLEKLQNAGRLGLRDFMTFEVQRDREHPNIQNDAMKYDGQRYRAECKLAGRRYGEPFSVDVAFGDPFVGEPVSIQIADVLAFAGVPPLVVRLYPLETHLAEKLHAYTMPRPRPNSRVKDLPDLALIATLGPLDSVRVREALALTFEFRGTHPLPTSVPEPPRQWREAYARTARENDLPWQTIEEVYAAVAAFLDPVLGEQAVVSWTPAEWRWSSRS